MVKSSTAPDELLCTLEDIGSVNIYPSAWTLTTEGYFPVEFQRDIVNIPKKSLLDALAVFLRGHRVEGLYGISKRSPGDTMWTEEELPDGHGTRAVPRKSEKSTGARTTEWRSVLGVGGIYTPVPHVECVEPPYGGHGGDPNKPKPK